MEKGLGRKEMLTILFAYTGDEENLVISLNSIKQCIVDNYKNEKVKFSFVVNNAEEETFIKTYCELKEWKESVSVYTYEFESVNQAYYMGMNFVDTKYVCFGLPGDKIEINQKALEQLKESKTDILLGQSKYMIKGISVDKYDKKKSVLNTTKVSLLTSPEFVPTEIYGYVVAADKLKNSLDSNNVLSDSFVGYLYNMLLDKPEIEFVDDIVVDSVYILPVNKELYREALSKQWYLTSMQKIFLPVIQTYSEKYGEVPLFVQYAIMYHIMWRFRFNINNSNKHIIDDDVEEFYSLITKILEFISLKVIFDVYAAALISLKASEKFSFLYLKYKKSPQTNIVYNKSKLLLVVEDVVLQNLTSRSAIIDLLDYKDENLIVDFSVDSFVDIEDMSISAYLNDKLIQLEETYRYAHTKYFGQSVFKKKTYRVTIPNNYFTEKENEFCLFWNYKDVKVPIKFKTANYNAKVATGVKHSYWVFDEKYMALFLNKNKSLVIRKVSLIEKIKKELNYLKALNASRACSKEIFLVRIAYWITKFYYKNKNIWLTYDKLYKGGDCGEYFYKYMCTQKDGITPVYVVNKDASDYIRLKKQGYKPVKYGTLKHRLCYLNSNVVFTTHGGVHAFNAFDNKEVKYVQDLLHHDVACIQHGLTVQQLAFNSNRLFNNMKRYYCASKYEIANLAHPIYGYEDKSVLKLTGIPRYDGLVNNDKKQILITPTWRNYIAMPIAKKNQAKPYNPDFVKTDYFKIYNRLITDEKLIQTTRKYGYKIIYLLHPVISVQIDDYPKIDGVEIVPASTVDYEKILTESSLMVTDYSGVQFDFAYMRKPVVYYHPEALPPHYKEGGFFYDSMGFGEICTEHDELVDYLCEYIENECQMKEFYKERQNDFFAYSDTNSCKRIYDDMLMYQKSKVRKEVL